MPRARSDSTPSNSSSRSAWASLGKPIWKACSTTRIIAPSIISMLLGSSPEAITPSTVRQASAVAGYTA